MNIALVCASHLSGAMTSTVCGGYVPAITVTRNLVSGLFKGRRSCLRAIRASMMRLALHQRRCRAGLDDLGGVAPTQADQAALVRIDAGDVIGRVVVPLAAEV